MVIVFGSWLVIAAERLDFTSHWIASEEDYSIEKAMKVAISELMTSAKSEELLDLFHNMDIPANNK